MWKIIKFLNKRLNEMLCVRMKRLIRRGKFPRLDDNDLTILRRSKWGSAPKDYDSVHTESCVCGGSPLCLETRKSSIIGYDYYGNPVLREWVSGNVWDIVRPKKHNITVEFDPNHDGAFDAVWFLGDMKRYREVDIERMQVGDDKDTILVSVHDGKSSERGRRLYNHRYPLVDNKVRFTFKFGWFTRIYMNDILIFVGLQWRIKGACKFIANSGVVPSAVKRNEGKFIIHNIEHRL